MKHILITIAALVLVGCGNSGYKYIQSVKEGDIAAVKSHLDAGVDINFVDMATEPRAIFEEGNYNVFGKSALQIAAELGYKKILELLIAEGANVNAKNHFGKTSLDYAIQYDQSEIADLLHKHGGKTGEELKAEGK